MEQGQVKDYHVGAHCCGEEVDEPTICASLYILAVPASQQAGGTIETFSIIRVLS
jgi:hypothetical protein